VKRKLVARRRSSFKSIAVLTLLPVGAFLIWYAFSWANQQLHQRKEQQARAPVAPSEPVKRATLVEGQAPPPVRVPVAPPQRQSKAPAVRHHSGEIVLILDDVGFDHQPIEQAMKIDPNVNFSILPNGAEAEAFAATLHENGFELLCHLPMEPIDYPRQQPGRNAILMSMSDEEITAKTRLNVESVPYARGVNNHMGSRATLDSRVMRDVLTALPKDLYFIDSRTSEHSIAGRMAHEMNIRTASRNVFLDDIQTESAVKKQVALLSAIAQQRGLAIGIGHPHPVTIRVLNEMAPELRAKGLRFVRASDAVR